MNRIIIDPHFCSREEYQELEDYLTQKSWDWREILKRNLCTEKTYDDHSLALKGLTEVVRQLNKEISNLKEHYNGHGHRELMKKNEYSIHDDNYQPVKKG